MLEAAAHPCAVRVRDSKLGNSTQIRLSTVAWTAFLQRISIP
ncbi:DUF397 domain-containing protein [Streptoverticillium reticulum]